jgi:hypothetical protein
VAPVVLVIGFGIPIYDNAKGKKKSQRPKVSLLGLTLLFSRES